jgi:TM2 domain-containing membrane protein YozV
MVFGNPMSVRTLIGSLLLWRSFSGSHQFYKRKQMQNGAGTGSLAACRAATIPAISLSLQRI